MRVTAIHQRAAASEHKAALAREFNVFRDLCKVARRFRYGCKPRPVRFSVGITVAEMGDIPACCRGSIRCAALAAGYRGE
jgi:hypothetical protein